MIEIKFALMWIVSLLTMLSIHGCEDKSSQIVSDNDAIVIVDRRMAHDQLHYIFYEDHLFVQKEPFPGEGVTARWLLQNQMSTKAEVKKLLKETKTPASKTFIPGELKSFGFVIEPPYLTTSTYTKYYQLNTELLDFIKNIHLDQNSLVKDVPESFANIDYVRLYLMRESSAEAENERQLRIAIAL